MVAERELGERRDACEERNERRAPRGFSARGDRVGGGASSAKQEVAVGERAADTSPAHCGRRKMTSSPLVGWAGQERRIGKIFIFFFYSFCLIFLTDRKSVV